MDSTRPQLSIVIACYNDGDIQNTVRSLCDTTCPMTSEIVVIDDASHRPVQISAGKVIRTGRRIGVGPARTLGAIHAKGDYLLFTDAHCRFYPGWFDHASVIAAEDRRGVLHCASCVGIDNNGNRNGQTYYGARMNFYGDDPNVRGKKQVLECNWGPEVEDGAELSACMGACYFVHRRTFLTFMPLRFLRSWGGDEQALSLKYWLFGDGIRFLKNIQIGHKFREPKQRVPFPLRTWETLYNKLFLIHTMLPPAEANILLSKIPKGGDWNLATRAINEDWHIIEYEKARNAVMFTESGRHFSDYLAKFQLPFPQK